MVATILDGSWGQPCWPIVQARGIRIEHWGPRGGSGAVHDNSDDKLLACLRGGRGLKFIFDGAVCTLPSRKLRVVTTVTQLSVLRDTAREVLNPDMCLTPSVKY